MTFIKKFDSELFIGAFNVFVYSIGFLNIIATFICKITSEPENAELVTDSRGDSYFNIYKALLIIFSLMMIIISVNLIRGIIKKTFSYIVTWLMMSFAVLVYQALFLLDQAVFAFAFGYILYAPLVIIGLCIIFVIHIVCFKKILKFSLNLYKNNILQREDIAFIKNSTLKTQNYHRNLTQNDSSILVPLNEEELNKQYVNADNVNLNKFEI